MNQSLRNQREQWPLHHVIQKVGVGLRSQHVNYILENKPSIPWFEILADNYLSQGGIHLKYLEKIREDYPLTFHCVGMSIGSTDGLDIDYFDKLKKLIRRFEPVYVSDHLCWTGVSGLHAHELLPLPYTETTVHFVAEQILRAQDLLGQRIMIENVSSYLSYKDSVMTEWEFVAAVADKADCDVLLDINNIFVSASNHNFDAECYLKEIPVNRVREMHLAGYEQMQNYLLDTHGEPVHQPVWELYSKAISLFGNVPTLIEWDNNIPEFSVLQEEAIKAQDIMEQHARVVI